MKGEFAMKIDNYKKLSENIQIPDIVMEKYQSAITQIKDGKKIQLADTKQSKSIVGKFDGFLKVAGIVMALLIVTEGAVLSVRAYINHLERMRNMDKREIIDMYENIFHYDSKYMSRGLSETEEIRYGELEKLYCTDKAEPQGTVTLIDLSKKYKGKGLAFSREDGILYLPETEMSDEQMLQLIEFNILRQYVDYEAYTKVTNPSYYLNRLDQMKREEVDECYVTYYSANTETSFASRELTFEEMGRRKILKDLYKKGISVPASEMLVIENQDKYEVGSLAFCKNTCTFMLPTDAMTDEQLLELLDFQIKVDYSRKRIAEEISCGERTGYPEIEYVARDRIITLSPDMGINSEWISQEWVISYSEILDNYFEENKKYYDDSDRYYANIRFIYLNDDDIPEMLFSHGYTDMDYDDNSNLRTYLYTYKEGKAILLSPGEDTIDDFYGYSKAFSYVEGKGMVYCDYYYNYGFSSYDNQTGIIDNTRDQMSRMDVWDLSLLTCTSTNANIKILHAEYNYENEDYEDAKFWYDYYINVSDVILDEETREVCEIVGEKVDEDSYEQAEKELWGGEIVTTLQVSDFDKIYFDDNIQEALAKCYVKQCGINN